MLDIAAPKGAPLPTKLEMGLIGHWSGDLAAEVSSGPEDQQQGLPDDPDAELLKGGPFKGVLRDLQARVGFPDDKEDQEGKGDQEGMSLAAKRQLTIGASWAAPVRS